MTMPIDWQIKLFQNLPSTQDVAMALAEDEGEEGTVIQALTQSKGRGRRGNQWEAPIGNLYLSFLLRPDFDFQKAGQVSFIVALAVARAVQNYIKPDAHKVQAKWPNDILVNGLKISGILLESSMKDNALSGLVVGIGVNVFAKPDLATSLNDVAKEPVYVNKVRDDILKEFSDIYSQWQKDGFTFVHKEWLSIAYGVGENITARLPNISYKGEFQSINDDGALILKEANGRERIIHAAEVYFGEAP